MLSLPFSLLLSDPAPFFFDLCPSCCSSSTVCPHLLCCRALLWSCCHLSCTALHELQRSTQVNTGRQPRQHRAIDLVLWERWWVSWLVSKRVTTPRSRLHHPRSFGWGRLAKKKSIRPKTLSECWSAENARGAIRANSRAAHEFRLTFVYPSIHPPISSVSSSMSGGVLVPFPSRQRAKPGNIPWTCRQSITGHTPSTLSLTPRASLESHHFHLIHYSFIRAKSRVAVQHLLLHFVKLKTSFTANCFSASN